VIVDRLQIPARRKIMSRVARPKDALNDDQRRKLLEIARESVRAATRGQPCLQFQIDDPALQEPRAVFVTLTRGGALRGCLGEFEGRDPVWRAVSERAGASAQNDPRFSPVTPEEVDDLRIEISVLRPLRRIEKVDEIEVGRHGLLISKGLQRGTLLPQVAVERGWDRITFLRQTCWKAGLDEDAWREGAEIYTYEADVFGEEDL
jgi:AmmeMemoRadiSam system protein A